MSLSRRRGGISRQRHNQRRRADKGPERPVAEMAWLDGVPYQKLACGHQLVAIVPNGHVKGRIWRRCGDCRDVGNFDNDQRVPRGKHDRMPR